MIVVLDEAPDVAFEITRQVVVLKQDAVFQSLMPALDLALGLRMMRRAAHVAHALIVEPFSKLGVDTDPLSLKRRGLWTTRAWSHPDAVSASCNVSVTSSAFMVVHSFQAMM